MRHISKLCNCHKFHKDKLYHYHSLEANMIKVTSTFVLKHKQNSVVCSTMTQEIKEIWIQIRIRSYCIL